MKWILKVNEYYERERIYIYIYIKFDRQFFSASLKYNYLYTILL